MYMEAPDLHSKFLGDLLKKDFQMWCSIDVCDDTILPYSRPPRISSQCFFHRHTFYSSTPPPDNAVIIHGKPSVICSVDKQTIFYHAFIYMYPFPF